MSYLKALQLTRISISFVQFLSPSPSPVWSHRSMNGSKENSQGRRDMIRHLYRYRADTMGNRNQVGPRHSDSISQIQMVMRTRELVTRSGNNNRVGTWGTTKRTRVCGTESITWHRPRASGLRISHRNRGSTSRFSVKIK